MFKYPGHQGHLRKKKSGKKRRKQKQPHINVFWTCFLFVCFCFSFVVVGLQSSLKVVVWIFVAFVPVIFQTVVCLFVRISARFFGICLNPWGRPKALHKTKKSPICSGISSLLSRVDRSSKCSKMM